MSSRPGSPARSPRGRQFGVSLLVVLVFVIGAFGIYQRSSEALVQVGNKPFQKFTAQHKTRRVLHAPTEQATAGNPSPRNDPPSQRWEQNSEAMFLRDKERRNQGLQSLIGEGFNPWDIPRGRFIWDWFSPAFVCPHMERIGRLGDGGKWFCGPEDMFAEAEKCVIYSFGVRDDVTFEQEMTQRSGGKCEVHLFDPSVHGLPQYALGNPQLHFHKTALVPHSGPDSYWPMTNSLAGHMREQGHTHLDVLKIDCEGCEWDVFSALLESSAPLPFDQLLIELHLDNSTDHEMMRQQMFHLFEGLEARGFRTFAREINIGPTLTGQLPIACEFSFMRNKALHLPEPQPQLPALSTASTLRAAVYVLVNPDRMTQLRMMLTQLHEHFNHEYKYPIILFHDKEISQTQKAYLTHDNQWTWIRFEAIELSLSALEPSYNPDEVPEATECAPTRLFYRHMCRFHAIEASRRMSELGFEWHWRLDDDSRIEADVGYDVFRLMANNNMLYSYVDVVQEEKKCYTSMWDLAEQHLMLNNLEPSFFYEWPEGLVFYNNFEISHESVWKDPRVDAWMQTVRESKGIYLSRWGDAPIRTVAVSMFVDPKRVHRFADLGYSHRPLFTQRPRGHMALGLGAVQSALCLHEGTWIPGSNTSSDCTPLVDPSTLKFYTTSKAIAQKEVLLGDGMASSCSAPVLSTAVSQRCELPIKRNATQRAVVGDSLLTSTPASDLQPMFAIQGQGLLGTDIVTSISLPSSSGSPRSLWLLGDTMWGKYEQATCSRATKAFTRNMFAVSNGNQTCFHYKLGSDLAPTHLMNPPGHTDMSMNQQHWWWVFGGMMLEDKLYLIGADFWLAPHTMFHSQGTLVWIVSNPEDEVHDWKYTRSYINKDPKLHWYAGITQRGGYVYLAGSYEDASAQRRFKTPHGDELEKGIVMARISTSAFIGLAWEELQYWDGKAWSQKAAWQSSQLLQPVTFHTGGGETTLAYDDQLKIWYMLFSRQQERNQIMLHHASSPEGPWSVTELWVPPEPFTDITRFMCYAAKSHPELAGDSQIVFTYVCTRRPWTWPGETNVYVPQFVRVDISRNSKRPLVQTLELDDQLEKVGQVEQVGKVFLESPLKTTAARLKPSKGPKVATSRVL